MRIVFMGTPEFAAENLRALVEGGYEVAGVVTAPDKPAGRGHQLQPSAVKQYALSQGLPLLQPEKLRDPDFLQNLRAWQADVQVVVAFRMLPEVVWAMPPLGTFNLHASLLPQYRGAAPINWAIINGETETGVTTFFLTHTIDTGNLILQERTAIAPTDNAGTVHDRLMTLGAELVKRTLDLIAAGKANPQPQLQTDELREAPKIFKETCRIDWNHCAEEIHNLVRGLSPYPAAWTDLTLSGGEPLTLKVYETSFEPTPPQHAPGTVVTDGKTTLRVAAADGYMSLLAVQPAGKRRMSIEEFLRGKKGFDNSTSSLHRSAQPLVSVP